MASICSVRDAIKAREPLIRPFAENAALDIMTRPTRWSNTSVMLPSSVAEAITKSSKVAVGTRPLQPVLAEAWRAAWSDVRNVYETSATAWDDSDLRLALMTRLMFSKFLDRSLRKYEYQLASTPILGRKIKTLLEALVYLDSQGDTLRRIAITVKQDRHHNAPAKSMHFRTWLASLENNLCREALQDPSPSADEIAYRLMQLVEDCHDELGAPRVSSPFIAALLHQEAIDAVMSVLQDAA